MRFANWLRENEMPQLPDAKTVIYTACILHKYSQTSLVTAVQKWMFENTGSGIPAGWIIRAHHMTVKFGPRQSDIEASATLLGKEIELQVTDWASDDHGVAVVVRPKVNLPLGNATPHVTIAHSRDVGAAYSNTLLTDRSKWVPLYEKRMNLNSELVCVLRDNVSTVPQLINPASPTL